MDNESGHGLSRAHTSVCVSQIDGEGIESDFQDTDVDYFSSTIQSMNDMGTFCFDTVDFDDFQISSKSPSTTNVLEMEGCTLTENIAETSMDDCLHNDNAFSGGVSAVDSNFKETVQVLFSSPSDDNENVGNTSELNPDYDINNISLSQKKRDDGHFNRVAETIADFEVIDRVYDERFDTGRRDKRLNESQRDDLDDADVSAGLRELLQKLFLTIKRFIPIQSANIQELLERTPFSETNDSTKDEENISEARLNANELFDFENIIQKLFNDFQDEWVAYQTVQEKRLDDIFIRGVQAARHHAEIEAAEAREEAARAEAPDIPAIVTKCSGMIKKLRRERSVLAKYIIEKQHEWGLLRGSLAREIATLRKDNTRLLSNKLASVNANGHGKGSKIAPFNQRTLESMVHSKYCLEKALMLDVAKQSKINELHLVVLQQQEHIRELQATLFDRSSVSLKEEVKDDSIDQRPIEIETTAEGLSDSEIIDNILKDMASRVLCRDDVDNVMQVLYCDEDTYMPNSVTSADLATLRVYCLGGTWRSNTDCLKLNALRPPYENSGGRATIGTSNSEVGKPAKHSGDVNAEKTTIVVTSPIENTPR